MIDPATPDWVTSLPAINASLNGLATILLLRGGWLIHQKKRDAHRRTMLAAFGVSAAFLVCYLVYHFALHHFTGSGSKRFNGSESFRPIYLVILMTHIVLAACVAVLAPVTIGLGLKADKQEKLGQPANWNAHRKLAKVTFPIWLYVSITGVVIYFLVYHWPPG